eukprot:4971828-Prymnesium_polylepis.1
MNAAVIAACPALPSPPSPRTVWSGAKGRVSPLESARRAHARAASFSPRVPLCPPPPPVSPTRLTQHRPWPTDASAVANWRHCNG